MARIYKGLRRCLSKRRGAFAKIALFAIAANALIVPTGRAAFYTYETWWPYMFRPCYCLDESWAMSGEDSGLLVTVYRLDVLEGEDALYVFKFDAGGAKVAEWLVENFYYGPFLYSVLGFTAFQGDFIVSYQAWAPGQPSLAWSTLRRCGVSSWVITEKDPFNEKYYFRQLAAPASGNYYYCYRWHNEAFRVCKSPGTPEVISYFTPVAGGVSCMEADGLGHVYISRGFTIRKYDESGSVLTSWDNPCYVWDLTVDGDGRLLVLSEDKNTYVYSGSGSLLGSFTGPYMTDIGTADIGPGGKYYVLGSAHDRTTLIMYRFAPGPSIINITPTSFGKIKAIYK
jgi:hypothetical protein